MENHTLNTIVLADNTASVSLILTTRSLLNATTVGDIVILDGAHIHICNDFIHLGAGKQALWKMSPHDEALRTPHTIMQQVRGKTSNAAKIWRRCEVDTPIFTPGGDGTNTAERWLYVSEQSYPDLLPHLHLPNHITNIGANIYGDTPEQHETSDDEDSNPSLAARINSLRTPSDEDTGPGTEGAVAEAELANTVRALLTQSAPEDEIIDETIDSLIDMGHTATTFNEYIMRNGQPPPGTNALVQWLRSSHTLLSTSAAAAATMMLQGCARAEPASHEQEWNTPSKILLKCTQSGCHLQ